MTQKASPGFFRLSDVKDEDGLPEYPGAVFLKFIVRLAYESKVKLPSQVYQEFKKNPKDFLLLAGYENYKAEKELKQQREAEAKTKKPFGK